MTIYMAVTLDKYELPYAVADTAGELATMVGCNEKTIYSSISNVKKGRIKRSRYIRVSIDDSNTDEERDN